MRKTPCDLQSLIERCRTAQLPVTVQRRAILAALAGRCDHPRAEEICSQVTRSLPGVNRATIYRSLEALAAAGVIDRVPSVGGTFRYDARIDLHHHLICDQCGRIDDLGAESLPRVKIPARTGEGFAVRTASMVFRGVCRACQRDSRIARSSSTATKGKRHAAKQA